MPGLKLKRWADKEVKIDPLLAFNYPIEQHQSCAVNGVYFKYSVVILIRFLET